MLRRETLYQGGKLYIKGGKLLAGLKKSFPRSQPYSAKGLEP